MREFDKIFFEFPLCLLSYQDKRYLEMIMHYFIVENSKKIKLFDKKLFSRINSELLPKDFDIEDLRGCIITISAFQLKVTLISIELAKQDHSLLQTYLFNYKSKYGDDAYCRVGKTIFEETKRKVFDESSFKFLCALSSILGKKSLFKRITKEGLAIRMLGFKTKEIYLAENCNTKIFSRGQMERLTTRLNERCFFTKFTYSNRITYYSTKLDYEELVNCIMKTKAVYIDGKMKMRDKEYTLLIKANIENFRKRKEVKTCTERAQIHSLANH